MHVQFIGLTYSQMTIAILQAVEKYNSDSFEILEGDMTRVASLVIIFFEMFDSKWATGPWLNFFFLLRSSAVSISLYSFTYHVYPILSAPSGKVSFWPSIYGQTCQTFFFEPNAWLQWFMGKPWWPCFAHAIAIWSDVLQPSTHVDTYCTMLRF